MSLLGRVELSTSMKLQGLNVNYGSGLLLLIQSIPVSVKKRFWHYRSLVKPTRDSWVHSPSDRPSSVGRNHGQSDSRSSRLQKRCNKQPNVRVEERKEEENNEKGPDSLSLRLSNYSIDHQDQERFGFLSLLSTLCFFRKLDVLYRCASSAIFKCSQHHLLR